MCPVVQQETTAPVGEKIDPSEVALARAFAFRAKKYFGDAILVTINDNTVTIDATKAPIHEKKWDNFTFTASANKAIPIIKAIRIAIKDENGVLSEIDSGSASVSDVICHKHKKSIMNNEETAVKNGKTQWMQSVPQLAHVDSVLENFDTPTKYKPKYVMGVTASAGCCPYYCCL